MKKRKEKPRLKDSYFDGYEYRGYRVRTSLVIEGKDEYRPIVNGKLNSYGYGKQNSHGHGKQKSHKDGKWNSHFKRAPVRFKKTLQERK